MVGVLVDGWRLEKKLFKLFKFNSETNKNWSERKHFSDKKKTETSSSAVETNWKINSTTKKL